MRARFSDPQGPWRWRAAPYAVPTLLFAGGIMGGLAGLPTGALLGSSLVALFAAGLVPMFQLNRRDAELTVGPGYVDIQSAGTRNQRIQAKSISGASTARTSTGILLTLAHARRAAPLVLEVGTEAEAERVRHALGVGHAGFGTIAWYTAAGSNPKAGAIGRVLVISIALAVALTAVFAGGSAAFALGGLLSMVLFCGVTLSIVGWFSRPGIRHVMMSAQGLWLWTFRGWFGLPYANVLDVRIERDRIVFVVPPPYNEVAVERTRVWGTEGISDDAAAALAAQVKTAAARARGLGPLKDEVAGRLEMLRRKGESPRDWLVRLDMAGQMLAAGSGYRGNTLDAQDLWAVLEDPEADAELRAAAARVLRASGLPEAKVRIDAAVAAVRDERTNRKLRIAIGDDLDNATMELATLDAQERPRWHAAPQGVRW